MGPAALTFESVSFAFDPSRPCVEGLSFTLPAGGKLCLMGANGSGKSTIARLAAGLLRPVSGRVKAGAVAYVAQDPEANIVGETVGEDVGFALTLRGLPRDEAERRVRSSLRAVGMDWAIERPMHSLSGGEVQRVALAAALAQGAELLVMDEPTSHLPQDEAERFWAAVAGAAAEGGPALLYTTHEPAEAAFADTVAILAYGAVAAWGSPGELSVRARLLEALGIQPDALLAAARLLGAGEFGARWRAAAEKVVVEACSRLSG